LSQDLNLPNNSVETCQTIPRFTPQDLSGQTSATWQRQVPLDTTVHSGDRARTYTITATVSDLAGNTTTSSTHVIICRGMSGYNQ